MPMTAVVYTIIQMCMPLLRAHASHRIAPMLRCCFSQREIPPPQNGCNEVARQDGVRPTASATQRYDAIVLPWFVSCWRTCQSYVIIIDNDCLAAVHYNAQKHGA